jgi:hypothetical protein
MSYDNNPEWNDVNDDVDNARYLRNNRRNQGNQTSNRLPVPRIPELTLERLAAMSAKLEEEMSKDRLQERRNPRGRVERMWNAPYEDIILQEKSCPICMEDFENGDDIMYPKECGHEFHEECLLNVMENYPVGEAPCPMCRTRFFGSRKTRNR